MNIARHTAVAAAIAAAAVAAGCGGGEAKSENPPAVKVGPSQEGLEAARQVKASDFPQVDGRNLQQMADLADPGAEGALAVSVVLPGENRIAFGMIDAQRKFVYGKSAIYIGRDATSRAEGPYPAPADSLIVDPPFRSATIPGEDIAAIYSTKARFKEPGKYEALIVTKKDGKLIGAPTALKVTKRNPVPNVGEKAPVVETDTVASARGDIKSIDTRVPNDDMHKTSFKDVVGKKPVALLFSTPALCESRVCGPVVDIAAQLKKDYGDRVEFIHQEVYVDNVVEKGLRPPLLAFNLQTEPWLFTTGADGRVAARLEGSFGINEFRGALDAALER